jgi:hypothetical protein
MKKRVATNTTTFRSRSSAEMKAMFKAERRVKKSGLGRVIASRVLTEENARDHKITVTIGAPRRVQADHWLCPYFIEGIVESGIHYMYGVDALQALVSALGGIRWDLGNTGRDFIWFAGDHGIPRQVQTGLGKNFQQRIERAIERESKRVYVGRMRARKREIASAEARLKVLKKGAFRWKEPAGKANLKAEVARQEARIKAAKKHTAKWEADLKKWKP